MINDIFTAENIKLICELIILPFLAYLTKTLVGYLRTKQGAIKDSNKSDNEKDILNKVYDIVVNCIECTNQTYADALRKEGKFDLDAQKEALQLTTQAVLNLLTEETRNVLNETVGDINIYLNTLIESVIKQSKKDTVTTE